MDNMDNLDALEGVDDVIYSRELENKQLMEIIQDVYDELYEEYEILIPPDNDYGIFKYIGSSPQAQFYINKVCRRREVQRPGLGFVIRRAELPDYFRVSLDIEVSKEVTRKDPSLFVEMMRQYAYSQIQGQAPEFIVYIHPVHSGKRNWSDKVFVGIEIQVTDKEFQKLDRVLKKIVDNARKLFHAVDFALTNEAGG
ncbi:MAG: hypothetical protein GC154_05220 [bacterium]|nr:hypothetical protein [bacterium]